jgi:hypothetical protein
MPNGPNEKSKGAGLSAPASDEIPLSRQTTNRREAREKLIERWRGELIADEPLAIQLLILECGIHMAILRAH